MEHHERVRPENIGQLRAYDPANDLVRERWHCMCDLAELLGGESLESFENCVDYLNRNHAVLSHDSSPFSLGFSVKFGEGTLFGGMIFHRSDRTWSLHT